MMVLGYSGQPFTLSWSKAGNVYFLHHVLYQKTSIPLILMSSTHCCGKWREKKPSLGASHACGRCEVLNFVWQGHSSEAKVKEIDSATRRNSIPLKYEGKTEGEERRASLELLDFVQSRKIICSLHLPQHHMLPLNPSFWTWKDQNLMVFMRLKSWAIGNFL